MTFVEKTQTLTRAIYSLPPWTAILVLAAAAAVVWLALRAQRKKK